MIGKLEDLMFIANKYISLAGRYTNLAGAAYQSGDYVAASNYIDLSNKWIERADKICSAVEETIK